MERSFAEIGDILAKLWQKTPLKKQFNTSTAIQNVEIQPVKGCQNGKGRSEQLLLQI